MIAKSNSILARALSLLILFAALSSFQAAAKAGNCENLLSGEGAILEASKNYFARECHIDRNCNTNVIELMRVLGEQPEGKVLLSEMNVLYLIPKERTLLIEKYERPTSFIFHVVLEHDGRIYDPFAPETFGHPLAEYLEEMLALSKSERNADLKIRSIPALEYASDHFGFLADGTQLNADFYLKHAEGYYPAVPYADFSVQAPPLGRPSVVSNQARLEIYPDWMSLRRGGSVAFFDIYRTSVGVTGPLAADEAFHAEFKEVVRKSFARVPYDLRESWRDFVE